MNRNDLIGLGLWDGDPLTNLEETQLIPINWQARSLSGRGQRLETQRIRKQAARWHGDIITLCLLLLLLLAGCI